MLKYKKKYIYVLNIFKRTHRKRKTFESAYNGTHDDNNNCIVFQSKQFERNQHNKIHCMLSKKKQDNIFESYDN